MSILTAPTCTRARRSSRHRTLLPLAAASSCRSLPSPGSGDPWPQSAVPPQPRPEAVVMLGSSSSNDPLSILAVDFGPAPAPSCLLRRGISCRDVAQKVVGFQSLLKRKESAKKNVQWRIANAPRCKGREGESPQRLRRHSDLVSDHSSSTTLGTKGGKDEVWEGKDGRDVGVMRAPRRRAVQKHRVISCRSYLDTMPEAVGCHCEFHVGALRNDSEDKKEGRVVRDLGEGWLMNSGSLDGRGPLDEVHTCHEDPDEGTSHEGIVGPGGRMA